MIKRIPDLPENVIGFEASGEVTADDYESVLVPAADKAIKEQGTVRLLYVLGPDVSGFTAGAMWEDSKVGLEHRKAWERFAMVTDMDWVRDAMKLFGWVVPGEVRVFGNDQLAEAKAWISA